METYVIAGILRGLLITGVAELGAGLLLGLTPCFADGEGNQAWVQTRDSTDPLGGGCFGEEDEGEEEADASEWELEVTHGRVCHLRIAGFVTSPH